MFSELPTLQQLLRLGSGDSDEDSRKDSGSGSGGNHDDDSDDFANGRKDNINGVSAIYSVDRLLPVTGQLTGRMAALAALPPPLGWLVRNFSMRGEPAAVASSGRVSALADAMGLSLASAAPVSPQQVLAFASSNVTWRITFSGVDWEAAAARATGLGAVRTALAQLAGSNFDVAHVVASLDAPLSTDLAGNAMAAGPRVGARRLLQQVRDAAQGRATTTAAVAIPVTVTAQYLHLDPANASTLLSALEGQCGSAAATASSSHASQATASRRHIKGGARVSDVCEAVFVAAFARAAMPVDYAQLSVVAATPPAAEVALCVAVGLSPEQAGDAVLVRQTSEWLGGVGVSDALARFNLTVAPLGFLAHLIDAANAVSGEAGLSGLLSGLLAGMGGDGASSPPRPLAAPSHSGQGTPTSRPSAGVVAGVVVAAVSATIALAGVGVMFFTRRSTCAGAATTSGLDVQRKTRRVRRCQRLPCGHPPCIALPTVAIAVLLPPTSPPRPPPPLHSLAAMRTAHQSICQLALARRRKQVLAMDPAPCHCHRSSSLPRCGAAYWTARRMQARRIQARPRQRLCVGTA